MSVDAQTRLSESAVSATRVTGFIAGVRHIIWIYVIKYNGFKCRRLFDWYVESDLSERQSNHICTHCNMLTTCVVFLMSAHLISTSSL